MGIVYHPKDTRIQNIGIEYPESRIQILNLKSLSVMLSRRDPFGISILPLIQYTIYRGDPCGMTVNQKIQNPNSKFQIPNLTKLSHTLTFSMYFIALFINLISLF